jgi:hypothetical protein
MIDHENKDSKHFAAFASINCPNKPAKICALTVIYCDCEYSGNNTCANFLCYTATNFGNCREII